MKEEIKEILDELAKKSSIYKMQISRGTSFNDDEYEASLLLDYITNLQEENGKYKHKFWEEQEQNQYSQDRIKELERYKNIIDEAIDYLRDIRQSTFTKYNSNEWNNCLSFNDDIKPLLDKLQKLQGSDE